MDASMTSLLGGSLSITSVVAFAFYLTCKNCGGRRSKCHSLCCDAEVGSNQSPSSSTRMEPVISAPLIVTPATAPAVETPHPEKAEP